MPVDAMLQYWKTTLIAMTMMGQCGVAHLRSLPALQGCWPPEGSSWWWW